MLKLVVWDLDDTFWVGTFSEGGVSLNPTNIDLIRQLNERGVINSIVSINSHQKTMSYLRDENLAKYFLFPSISWDAKGPRLKRLLHTIGIKPKNAIFIDDNKHALAEAANFVPGIRTVEAGFHVGQIRKELSILPVINSQERLSAYRAKEARVAALEDVVADSNEDFLKESDITVEIADAKSEDLERIVDLSNRSNQLNFTKSRLSSNDLSRYIENDEQTCKVIKATDRFGDYGTVGFYRVHADMVEDFFFSCRVLGFGIEQFVFQALDCPTINVVGEVAVKLSEARTVDWISLDSTRPGSSESSGDKSENLSWKQNVVWAGCDMDAAFEYSRFRESIYLSSNCVNEYGLPTHSEHSEIFRQVHEGTQKQIGCLESTGVVDAILKRRRVDFSAINSFSLSLLMDYYQGLYRHRETGAIVPFGRFDRDLTLHENECFLPKHASSSHPFLETLSLEFEFLGGICPDRLIENLDYIRQCLPAGTGLILINGAEIAGLKDEEALFRRHETLNDVVSFFCKTNNDTTLLDVRKFVRSRDDVLDSMRHYARSCYKGIGQMFDEIVFGHTKVS